MAMGDFFKGEPVSAGSKSSGQPCFGAANGVVTIQLPEVEEKFVLPLIPGLKVCNAFEGSNGRVHELCGQPYTYVVEHIYKNVFTEELRKARLATCIYAQQLAKSYESGEEYVETIFGLKFLSKEKKKEESKARFKTLQDSMSIF